MQEEAIRRFMRFPFVVVVTLFVFAMVCSTCSLKLLSSSVIRLVEGAGKAMAATSQARQKREEKKKRSEPCRRRGRVLVDVCC